jgi:Protein of unknown function (DUF1475)
MIWFLRGVFAVVLVSMLAVTFWASTQGSVLAIPRAVLTHPWFIATLFDTYWGFLTFYAWVAYKEDAWWSRALWLPAILLLGNIAMSIYCLIQLFAVPADASPAQVLLRAKQPVAWWVPAGLLAGITGIGLLA